MLYISTNIYIYIWYASEIPGVDKVMFLLVQDQVVFGIIEPKKTKAARLVCHANSTSHLFIANKSLSFFRSNGG